ncbi:single-stranded DNA-binding protein [Ruminococcus bicirculans (ex Wegman et al. 2014)]|uniref:single-stranded DNA-binding protein n=2 Tax=Oscillospiraceae TaxID=216572 RepID=UPI00366F45B8
MLRPYKDSKIPKIILDIGCKVKYNKSTTGTQKPETTKGRQIPMLNKFLVAGRLTADPEIKTIGEKRLCKFTIACDRPKRKGEETAETDFFPCTAWNRNADVIVDWFGKGDMVTLVGSVHNNRYEKDDQKRSSTEVKVEEIHFSGGKKRENTAPTANRYDNPYIGTENDPLF